MEKTKFIEIKNNLKLGLISDVHGNGDYLEIVIKEMLNKGVNGFLFVGDMITDFQDTKKIMNIIKNLQIKYPVISILGNREIDM